MSCTVLEGDILYCLGRRYGQQSKVGPPNRVRMPPSTHAAAALMLSGRRTYVLSALALLPCPPAAIILLLSVWSVTVWRQLYGYVC